MLQISTMMMSSIATSLVLLNYRAQYYRRIDLGGDRVHCTSPEGLLSTRATRSLDTLTLSIKSEVRVGGIRERGAKSV
jgi:hypothetical protein